MATRVPGTFNRRAFNRSAFDSSNLNSLAATPGAVASLTAQLTAQIVLGASPQSVASTNASLTTFINMAGLATGVSSAIGTLQVGATLAGTAAAAASAMGELSTGISLAASAAAVASGSADIQTQDLMAASVQAVASASGELETDILLAGGAGAQAAAAGDIQTSILLQAQLSAQSAAVTPAVPARSGETQPRPVPSQEPLSRQAQSPAVPAFIAAARCDEAYASTHPGWERYLGQECEFRVFRGGSRIKALQIMVVPGGAISGTFLQRVLSAMLGKSGYTVNSQVRKGKTVIQKGSVGPLADLLIYRALRSGAIRAFVLSIN